MNNLKTTPNCFLLDSESTFNKGLTLGSGAWILKPGEFDVEKPYFRERVVDESKQGSDQLAKPLSKPRKRRKVHVPSSSDIGLHEHHESIREFLVEAMEEA